MPHVGREKVGMLRVRKHEIEDGKYVILFTCDHQTPLPEKADPQTW